MGCNFESFAAQRLRGAFVLSSLVFVLTSLVIFRPVASEDTGRVSYHGLGEAPRIATLPCHCAVALVAATLQRLVAQMAAWTSF